MISLTMLSWFVKAHELTPRPPLLKREGELLECN
jgi:hypothetical protein